MNVAAKEQVNVPSTVLTDMKPRLQAAAIAVADAHKAYKLALEVRDELVETAINEGMSQRQVAAAAGFAPSRIQGIFLRRGRDDDEN